MHLFDTGIKLYRIRLLALTWAFALITSLNGNVLALQTDVLQLCSKLLVILAILIGIVLLRSPGSLILLRASAIIFLVIALIQLPALPNHRIVLALVALTILSQGLVRRSSRIPGAGVFTNSSSERITTTLQCITIIVYLFAALAKLNEAYINPVTSCAATFLKQALVLHGFSLDVAIAPNLLHGAIWWSILSEVLICLLLLVPRTRMLGVAFGVAFHMALAADYVKYFANFSAAMFILLISWLPEHAAERIWVRGVSFWRVITPFAAVAMSLTLLCVGINIIEPSTWIILRYLFFMIFASGLLINLVPLAIGDLIRAGAPPIWSWKTPIWTIIALAIINGLCPYLGLKSRNSFAMYSNLRLDAVGANHLLAPYSADVFGLLADRVEVISASDAKLSRTIEPPGRELPYIALCAYLANMDDTPRTPAVDTTVQYVRNGQRLIAKRGGQLPVDCPGWLARKLLFFGPIGEGSEKRCEW